MHKRYLGYHWLVVAISLSAETQDYLMKKFATKYDVLFQSREEDIKEFERLEVEAPQAFHQADDLMIIEDMTTAAAIEASDAAQLAYREKANRNKDKKKLKALEMSKKLLKKIEKIHFSQDLDNDDTESLSKKLKQEDHKDGTVGGNTGADMELGM